MMKKNKSNKKSKGIVSTAMTRTKDSVLKANETALARTEEFVTTSLEITAQWQTVADKALKGGLKLAAKQQDLIFDILNEVKSDLKISRKKFNKLVA
ncbi:MAG: hypothetical protein AAGJ12_12675 [Bacteroidota bacterium]